MKPSLTVLLPVHNRGGMTAAFIKHLDRILPSSYALSVVIFDDGCTDDTVECARKEWPSAAIIQLGGHAFWGGALNAAASYVQEQARQRMGSDYYLLCNDDIRFSTQASLLIALKATSDQTIVCARAVMVDHARIINADFTTSSTQSTATKAIHYCSRLGKFIPACDESRVNVASTWAMLTTQKPWLHSVAIPTSIPHYLSDYWLTYNLSKIGFHISHPEQFTCLVSIQTTRNVHKSSGQNWLESKNTRIKEITSKTSPEYAPAWISFYKQDSPSAVKHLKIIKLWLLFSFSKLVLAILNNRDKSKRSTT